MGPEPAERHFGGMGVTRPIDVMGTFLELKHRNAYLKERPALALHRTGDDHFQEHVAGSEAVCLAPSDARQLPTSE